MTMTVRPARENHQPFSALWILSKDSGEDLPEVGNVRAQFRPRDGPDGRKGAQETR